MFLYFLRTIQYFLMKFFTDVFSITLTVTTLKNKFSHYFSFSARDHFRYFGADLRYVGGCFERFFMKFCTDVLGSFYCKWCKIF